MGAGTRGADARAGSCASASTRRGDGPVPISSVCTLPRNADEEDHERGQGKPPPATHEHVGGERDRGQDERGRDVHVVTSMAETGDRQ
jgi:hypothetical protein